MVPDRPTTRTKTARLAAALALMAAMCTVLVPAMAHAATPGGREPAVATTATIATNATPVAQVRLNPLGREAQFDNFTGSLRARCATGHEFQELSVHGVQGDFTSPDWQVSPIVCDGRWKVVHFGSDPGFVPGSVTLTARFTVVDVESGDPARQAVDAREVWIRAATAIVLGRETNLKPDGTVVVHLWARCDQPWVEPELYVGVTQGNYFGSAHAAPGQVTCDDGWHAYHLRTTSDGFRRGTAQVDGSLSVLDPESFDPVAATQISRRTRVVGAAPAAEVRLADHAREGQRGTILGSLRARCAPVLEAKSLTMQVTQAGFTSPEQALEPITCDGAWHHVSFTTFDGFDPGFATLTSRLGLVDRTTGAGASGAVDVEEVWVRPATALRIDSVATLTSGRTVVSFLIRCDRPWAEPNLTATLGQAGHSSTRTVPTGALTCDEAWHRVRLSMGRGFHRGNADVAAQLGVYDPVTFDPVASTSGAREVRILDGR